MDNDTDIISIHSSPSVSIVQSKRCAIARMRTCHVRASRKKKSNAVKETIYVRKHGTTSTPSSSSERHAWAKVGLMKGSCPPFNDYGPFIEDAFTNKLYMVGGFRPGEPDASSDLYCLDVGTMKWTNLTYRNPYNPFCKEEARRATRPIPRLGHSGCAFFRLRDVSYIIIFGGFDEERKEASSQTVVINLAHNEWFYLHLEGGPVTGRVNPAVIVIKTKLFVFGGYTRMNKNDPGPQNSYSIAEYFPGESLWRWVVRDAEYPNLIPRNHAVGQAIQVYNGTKILLTPGRFADDKRIQFSEENLFLFHVERNRFQTVDVTGNFPQDVLWYSCFSNDIPVLPPPDAPKTPERKPRGRPRKDKAQAPASTIPVLPSNTTHPASAPCITICAWVPWGVKDATTDVWQLFLTPTERIDRLNIGKKVYDLDNDFEGVVMVGGKLLLMGYDPPEDWRMREDTNISDDEDVVDPDAVWNIYLEVPLSK